MMTTAPACLEWPHTATSVGRARSFVRGLCADACLPWELCETAALLTSEMVTNSLLHGRSDARLAVTVDETGLLVEVGDDDVRPPRRLPNETGALGGRGLAIVDHLASEWGTYPTATGKVVWFRLNQRSVSTTLPSA
jgi:anti-sigma regulatory factor (Ser/Thr protein kinase)